ncbi:hypothetical protein Fmac_021171 [Flemingia macrophylla]|uniref:Uncharacterized protein n=1 Tax=Flemingia macrophylla TaxID=520843 RepID=A0ABD1LW89_9FABA
MLLSILKLGGQASSSCILPFYQFEDLYSLHTAVTLQTNFCSICLLQPQVWSMAKHFLWMLGTSSLVSSLNNFLIELLWDQIFFSPLFPELGFLGFCNSAQWLCSCPKGLNSGFLCVISIVPCGDRSLVNFVVALILLFLGTFHYGWGMDIFGLSIIRIKNLNVNEDWLGIAFYAGFELNNASKPLFGFEDGKRGVENEGFEGKVSGK